MQVPKHVLIGCAFSGSPSDLAAAYVERFKGLGNYPPGSSQAGLRELDAHDSLSLAIMRHLDYETPPWIERCINEGFDVALDYFFGEWWLNDEERPLVDKRHPDRNLYWFKAFSYGLFLGLLTERWSDVAKLCSWIEADLRPEYIGDDLEDQGCQVYISMAASLRPEPMAGLAEVEANIQKCRTKRPRLLFKAWQAARSGNQLAFNKAMTASLEHFIANRHACGTGMTDWIAHHQSVVCLAAKRLGLQLPPLPEKLAALIVTRESLGFDSKGT